jgi:ATP-dependent Clp protease protease subunit
MKPLTIQNKSAKLKLTEQVDKYSMDDLIQEIERVYGANAAASGADFGAIMNCIENAADTMDIEIHSPGGSVLDGYRLYNSITELRKRGVYVTANITLAASMASVIAMAADKIVMRKGARMMIHEASAATMGDAEEHRNRAELLEGISDEIAEIYSNRTGIPQDEIRQSMKKETWMTGKQAVALGFADEDFDTAEKENTENISTMSILDRLTNPSDVEAKSKIESLESEIVNYESKIGELSAKLETAETALQEVAGEITALRIKDQEQAADIEAKAAEIESINTKVTELTAAAELTEEKVSARAAELLAAQGHVAAVNLADDTSDNQENLFAQYRKLQSTNPVAAAEFWDKHEKEIIAGQ